MKPISDFNDNLGTAIALVGGAGSGKTSLAGRLYPRTYFQVTDLNFTSGKDYWKKKNISNVIGFDTPMLQDDGKTQVPANQVYARMLKQVDDATKDPTIDCIAFDSGTFVEEILKARIANAPRWELARLEGFKQWGELILLWKSLLIQLRQSGKKIIWTFHENKEKDESDQIFKYQIRLDGSTKSLLPALFSDVWRCEVVEKGIGTDAKHIWQVRTLGNQRQEHLKNTFGFEAVLTADDLVAKVQTLQAK